MPDILIVEDEVIIRDSLKRLLERHGYRVMAAGSVAEAESGDQELSGFDLIIADLRLPGEDGTTLIAKAASVPVLIMTSYSSVQSAVDAMKMGAVDYLSKPFNHDEILMTVERVLHTRLLERQNKILQQELQEKYPVDGMVGSCDSMQNLLEHIRKIAATDATVLIQGETGTGKELVARALHAKGERHAKPLISVNCASIAENLIESELFGHEENSFNNTSERHRGLVEAADGGTLFLDEIGELSLEAQSRLLRLLQEGEVRRIGSNQPIHVDVRFLVATHRNLQQLVQEKKFREDLFYRLNVLEIELPPLRERGEDIQQLAKLTLNKIVKRIRRQPLTISEEALETLSAYHWPGNVRELENVIERAVILCDGQQIDVEDLALQCIKVIEVNNGLKNDLPRLDGDGGKLSLDNYLISFVKQNEATMNETELSKQLGISRKSLWERRQRLNIPRAK